MLSVIVGTTTATIAIVMMMAAAARKRVNEKGGCPNCGMPVPTVRNPTSLRQAFLGGWTCSECGTEMDRSGNELIHTVKVK
jgi:hypothetical protein